MKGSSITIADITGPNNDHDDGNAVYQAIRIALDAGQKIKLDFSGLDIVTPSFLNTSFRVLAKQYSYDFLRSRISIVNSNAFINVMIRDALMGRN